MRLISHRGNLNGPEPRDENTLSYIEYAIKAGYNVEIDVRSSEGQLFLGHDSVQEKISLDFLFNHKLWVHAKDAETVKKILEWNEYHSGWDNPMLGIHFFWHQNDDRAFTSLGYVWTYPGKELVGKSIAVLPELGTEWNISKAYGICSDHVKGYK